MKKRSKRYKNQIKDFDLTKKYKIEEAIEKIKQSPSVKFDESLDVAINLNLKTSQKIRGIVNFPYSTGKQRKILVFAKGEKSTEAKTAGADYVGDDDLIEKIRSGWVDFDVAIATPDMMKEVGKLGPILGKKGLMPNPKTGTVTFNLKEAIGEFKKGKYEFKSDKTGIIHISVGKLSMDNKDLIENIKSLIESVIKSKPSEVKGNFISSIYLSSTMGIGLKVDQSSIL